MLDFTKNPRASLRGTADHQAIRLGEREHIVRALWRIDVAVRHYGNSHRSFDGPYRLVVNGADERARARAPMDGERRNARPLRHLRDSNRIACLRCGPSA